MTMLSKIAIWNFQRRNLPQRVEKIEEIGGIDVDLLLFDCQSKLAVKHRHLAAEGRGGSVIQSHDLFFPEGA
jgi:hypothetical protein